MSTEIKRLEFELEKARNGLAMPYDRERVWQLRLSYAKRARSCVCARPSRWRPSPSMPLESSEATGAASIGGPRGAVELLRQALNSEGAELRVLVAKGSRQPDRRIFSGRRPRRI
jgi:hypothetical protein